MTTDEIFMLRAMELARNGCGNVSPNPMVGCVVVHDGKVVGEGWHQKIGEAHAEVNAINSVKDKSVLKHATVYVNLEPCAHYGKTPPCADMLVECGIRKVVISNEDPNPKVSGRGIQRLKAAGIDVTTNVRSAEGYQLNKRFFTSLTNKRPFVILKWAQTADGYIARKNFDSKWISNEYSRQLVHRWRAEEDADLVGYNTAAYDNPVLNVRDWKGSSPIRLVVDKHLKLDPGLNLFDKSNLTICYNLLKQEEQSNLSFVKISDTSSAHEILADLQGRNIQSVIIEGGAQTINAFVKANLWDEARVFTSKMKFVEGIKAPDFIGTLITSESIAEDRLDFFQNSQQSKTE